jgi:serine/threonine protein kinase
LALKEIDVNGINSKVAFEIAQEATTLATLIHPNIIQYIDSFLENDHFHIVTEYCQV